MDLSEFILLPQFKGFYHLPSQTGAYMDADINSCFISISCLVDTGRCLGTWCHPPRTANWMLVYLLGAVQTTVLCELCLGFSVQDTL